MSTRFSKMMSVRRPTLVSRKVLIDSLVRLNPLRLVANPVMLIVEITFFIVTALAIYPEGFPGVAALPPGYFYVRVDLFFLVTFGSGRFSDALGEAQPRITANGFQELERGYPARKILIEEG